MTSSPPLAASAPNERSQLVAAAERVLERSGWWGFKVESVLKEARLSTRSFYRHFNSKEDLVAGLLEDTLLKIANAVADVVEPHASPAERVRAYIRSLIDWALNPGFEKPAFMLANHWRELLPVHPELITRCLEAFVAPLVSALREGAEDRTILCSNPEADATSVFCLVSGVLFDLPRHGDDEIARAQMEALALPFVSRALGIPVDG